MIEIVNRHPELTLSEADCQLIEKTIVTTLADEGFDWPYEVAVIVVDAPTIRQYNRDYRAKDQATDVLSFVQYDEAGFVFNDDEPIFLGDIVLCYDIALAQASQYGHSAVRELSYLVCHSTLHLLGYDHIEAADKSEMRRREKAIMAQLNLEKVAQVGDEERR